MSVTQDRTGAPAAARGADADRRAWWVVLVAAGAGLTFTTVQIMEKITILKDPTAGLVCDISTTVSCTNVLNAWQSSVLGPPNALIGAIMFAILGSAALGGVLGGRPARSTCWCCGGWLCSSPCSPPGSCSRPRSPSGACACGGTGIVTMVLAICATLTRIADRAQAFGAGPFAGLMDTVVKSSLDLIIWGGWWLVIAAMLVVGLR